MSRNSNTRTTDPTTIPGIPKPPSDVSPSLRTYLEAVSEALEVRLGRRGDPRDRAITLRELINSGLAEELRNRPYNPNRPNDLDFLNPDADLSVPPRPTNFTATGGYSLIQLYWDYPRYGNHSQTEIWRHDSDSIGDAQLVGVSPGLAYVDAVGEGQSYYYWIRHVSTSGVPGPFNASAGTLAETALDVVLLLDTLVGAISESQLTAALSTRIDAIDASEVVVGSVNYRIAQEVAAEASARATAISDESAARAAAITAAVSGLQSQIDDLNAIDAWDSVTSYAIDDLVQHNSKLWKALTANTNSEPTVSNTNWSLIGDYTSLGDAVGNNTSDIQQINYVNAGSTSAAALAIVGLQTTVNNPTTGVVATATALDGLTSTVNNGTTGLAATVTRVSNLETTVNNPTTGVAATSSALSALTSRVTTAEGTITSNSSDITLLENTVNNPTSGVVATSNAVSGLDSRVTSAEGSISSNSSEITTLKNTVNNPTTGVAATAAGLSALDSRVTSAEGTISSQSTSITNLSNTLSGVQSSVSNLQTVTGANSTALSSLDSRVTTAEGTISSNSSSITSLSNTLSTTNSNLAAVSSSLSTLTNTVTAQGSSISTNASDITTLEGTVNNPTTGVVATANALSSLSSTVSSQGSTISSNSSAITALGNVVYDPSTGVSATAGALSTLSSTVSSQGASLSAVISNVSTLTTTVGNNTASIQTNATSVNGLEAQYTVKIDNNGAVAGYGLASTGTSAGNIISEFTVNADRFAILKNASDTGAPTVPFIVQTTTQTINGVSVPPGVYIADAFVRNGTITNAKIGNAAIDEAKIANASISTAKIQDASIFAAKIVNGEVTNAKIANAAITTAKIGDAQITTAKIGTAQVDTLQLAGESVIVPVADSYSGYLAPSWPTFRTAANGLPDPSITLTLATEVLILWGVRFQGQASGAGNIILEIYEGGTRLLNIGNTTSVPTAVSTGGFLGGTLRRAKSAGTYNYSMRWTAFNSPLYEAYIILLGIQR
jgi:uncharacterized coiled-coil protein SlyX